MTAINVVLEPGRAHVFADGGHFSGKVLRRIAVKTYPLAGFNAVLAWSGPSDDVSYVLDAVRLSGATSLPDLLAKIPVMIAGFGWKHPFSAIFVGVFAGAAMGVTVEQEDKVQSLGVWSTVKALPSAVAFDPSDIVGSGIRMIEDQRGHHGIVAGFVQHVEVSQTGIEARILRRWPDLVAGGQGGTHAAKIGDLQVDAINIKGAAITGAVTSTASGVNINVPNPDSLIVHIFSTVIYTVQGRVNVIFNANWILRRIRGTLNIDSGNITVPVMVPPGYSPGTVFSVTGSYIDQDAQPNEQYTIVNNPVPTSGTFAGTAGGSWVRTQQLTALYRKR